MAVAQSDSVGAGPDRPPGPRAPGERSARFAAVIGAAGATGIVLGLLWDVSWHRSIGRDTFWNPAHVAIYLGGLLAAASAVPLIVRATFRDGPDRRASVAVGPLRGPLGAWVMVWGAGAMLASAPFDDWWHRAYGLDVRMISPPHAVLAAGMACVVAGATLLTVSIQNRAAARDLAMIGALHVWVSGVLVALQATFLAEHTFPFHQHGWLFYAIVCEGFPVLLIASARASRRRFPATRVAIVSMGIIGLTNWLLPLFPAQARLGPIYNPVTRMVPMCFPLLIVFPAVAIDGLLSRFDGRPNARLAAALGLTFLAVFLAVQWPFASFQMTPASRNWFFGGDRTWSYWFHPETPWRYGFMPGPLDRWSGVGIFAAAVLAIVSSWAGLLAGGWMRRVQR
ncbi:MAG: hypothetical protein ABR610_02705 [Thermoanaerobaculia bacterium]